MIKKIIISTKTYNLIKYSNIITFKSQIELDKKNMKKIIKKLFGYKIEKINSLIGNKGYKKFFIKIDKHYSVSEIISNLGFKIV
ncbi:60S ribosomal protein L23 (nucleomorph) [Lotharella oceanica]|uniref:60S ribosomal protein L23 n=1 Tax=Lotharella oceanica TaxID=641309 RepID=A0A060DFP0_9EUKA|nr:60S ribosomal protein L23 [Lotharella oceanica]